VITQAKPIPPQEPLESAEAIMIRQIELEDARKQLSKRAKQPVGIKTPTIILNKLTDITQIH
jgi:hypothetical protein